MLIHACHPTNALYGRLVSLGWIATGPAAPRNDDAKQFPLLLHLVSVFS
jgi:hypothetical protein